MKQLTRCKTTSQQSPDIAKNIIPFRRAPDRRTLQATALCPLSLTDDRPIAIATPWIQQPA